MHSFVKRRKRAIIETLAEVNPAKWGKNIDRDKLSVREEYKGRKGNGTQTETEQLNNLNAAAFLTDVILIF